MEYKNIKPFVDDFEIKLNFVDAVKDADTSKGLIVTIDATHGGYVNRNFYFYQSKYMKKSVDSWIKPYAKPMLLHHRVGGMWQDAGDPIGRVLGAKFIDTGDDTGFIRLRVQISDPDAVEKVKDGRYLTVSTSQRPSGPVTCSICDNDLLTDGYCGHDRGKEYIIGDEDDDPKDKTVKLCYYIFSDLEYREVSAVNEPADQDDEHAATITKWEAMDSVDAEMGPHNAKDDVVHAAIVEVAKDALEQPVVDPPKEDKLPEDDGAADSPEGDTDGEQAGKKISDSTDGQEDEPSDTKDGIDEDDPKDKLDNDADKVLNVLKTDIWR